MKYSNILLAVLERDWSMIKLLIALAVLAYLYFGVFNDNNKSEEVGVVKSEGVEVVVKRPEIHYNLRR